jgi:hypothetical protein
MLYHHQLGMQTMTEWVHFATPGDAWFIWIEGKKVASEVSLKIYDRVHKHNASDYWLNKGNMDSCDFDVCFRQG